MYDVLVLGGGPGGYRAAELAGHAGLKVALVEKYRLGGVCLHRGCIPTKAYYCDVLGKMNPVERMWEKKNRIVEELEGGLRSLMDMHHVEVVEGTGKIHTAQGETKRLEVTAPDGTLRTLEGRFLILAPGSRSLLPDFPGNTLEEVISGDWAVTRSDLWNPAENDAVRSVAVAGAGVIAVELAGMLREMGRDVTLLKHSGEILRKCDGDIKKKVAQLFRKRGIAMIDSFHIDAVEKVASPQGILRISGSSKNREREEIFCDRLLVAYGMKPILDGYGLENSGVAVEKGAIAVNEAMETNIPGVYAVGDVTGGQMLAHEAEYEALAAVGAMRGKPCPVNRDAMPGCIFTEPEIATVGLTEEEARGRGLSVAVGKAFFLGNGMARAMGKTDGFVKVVADADRDLQILGVHVVGPEAAALIAEATLAVGARMTARQVAYTVHPHPTTSECFKDALFRLL
ncbi:MAG TPA: NAD(P)/FAD-dependent oxidoreductase [Synergistaceae bacterium]|nr:NAD(P)/FAD-dependent oxidoreductase [Synergistaceae bacterium]